MDQVAGRAASFTAVAATADHGAAENKHRINNLFFEQNNMELLEQAGTVAPESVQHVVVSPARDIGLNVLLEHLIAASVFSLVGVIVFIGCLVLTEKLTPFSIIHEIGEEHNIAVSIVVAAIVLGMSMIIAASIQG